MKATHRARVRVRVKARVRVRVRAIYSNYYLKFMFEMLILSRHNISIFYGYGSEAVLYVLICK